MSKYDLKFESEVNTETASPGQVEQTELDAVTRIENAQKVLSEEEEYAKAMRIVAETRYGVIYNARYVNVRDEPSPTANVIRIAEEGEKVIILYEENGYYKVQFQNKSEGFISSDFIEEIGTGDVPDDWFVKAESILTSVKKLLGIDEDCEEFDLDIMMNINGALSTLRQLGVGPVDGFMITNKNATYADFLGDDLSLISYVKMYLYHKTKLGFDPPQISSVLECLKEMIKEDEWRLNVQVDPSDTFKEDQEEEGGEIQNEDDLQQKFRLW